MTKTTTPVARVIGCDVGKTTIVVCDEDRIRTIDNDPQALAGFVSTLDPGCLIVCEATGGYEGALLTAALAAGVRIHRADARKVKAFIRSLGTLGKTDAIDAKALARYGRERHAGLALWQAREPARLRLQALVLTRRDLVAARVAWTNRRAAPGAEPAHTYLEAIVGAFDSQIDAVDADIDALIASTASIARAVDTLLSIKGLGRKTAAGLVALMPELGSLPRRRAAALAGLAPHPRQSGHTDAYRNTRGGRPEVKRLMFMAAMAARRSNPQLRDFYLRLVRNGKKPLVALTAIMRKLVVIANARLKEINATN
jgi:transposase